MANTNWLCIILVGVFLIAIVAFLWMHFARRNNFTRIAPALAARYRVRNPSTVVVPTAAACHPTSASAANTTYVDQPDSNLVAHAFGNSSLAGAANIEFVPRAEDGAAAGYSKNKASPSSRNLRDRFDSLYDSDRLPSSIEGHPLENHKLAYNRPRIRMGLSRLAQLADPYRGDIKITQTEQCGVSRYGYESLREGVFTC